MIDLFAGAGGLSTGLEAAGFRPVVANEIVPRHAATYKANHPGTNVLVEDLRKLDAGSLIKAMGGEMDIDLVAGGPPCQGFSINAPARSLEDPRNHLFKEFLRVVDFFRPRAVLIENVPGIVSFGKGAVVEAIHESLARMNYKVGHRILFAAHYGVPQMRFRTIFIALRDYEGEIEFPEPTHWASAAANFRESRELCFKLGEDDKERLKPKTTVLDAIGDLPSIEGGRREGDFPYDKPATSEYQILMRESSDGVSSHFSPNLAKINIERLRHIPMGGSWRDIPHELLPKGLQRARRSDHTRRYGRLHPNELCSTIMTKCDPHWGSFFHPFEPRIISAREAARIQSFPDRYVFTGSMTERYEGVGNAVPPLLAKAIGVSLMAMLDKSKSARTRIAAGGAANGQAS